MGGAGDRARIAVVDDDRLVRDVVCDALISGGFSVEGFSNAADLLAALAEPGNIDLIILDLQLPDRDGFAVAAAIRASNEIPIIMLTGRNGDIDRIMGLEIGADDYVVKPFNARELLARVKAVRRRLAPAAPQRGSQPPRRGYRFLGYEMDIDRRCLTSHDGQPIALTVAEFDLLRALVERAGRVLSRDQLLDMTHRANEDVFDRTIDVLILRLRRKIEPNPNSPSLIRTERGHGYIFDASVVPFDTGT